ncbi:Lipid kinase [Candidatus Methylobacter favarea]|uniref:Lipid kinase n=1 Tax=Candidatus Methylobacter favarea TaxID=2707345 RepID=A0A8S0XIC1_9GAMM|nr:lipid kinase [Candidatus Methylobacter favarea]CAA9890576.1 Lipid kinase [Candidatus Methylobacter favarea]
MTKRNALFISNKKSGKAVNELNGAVKILKDSNFNLIEQESESPSHTSDLIRQNRGIVDTVILAGGDGTMSSAAGALSECGLALGILPMGTANDLARTLKIPESLESAATIIANGRLHVIDLGKVNDRCFINAAHIGLGVKVNNTLTKDIKARWGRFSYARSLIDAFKSMRPYRADVVCDGEGFSVRSIHITVANGRFYGGGMALSTEASFDDHKLRIFSLEPQSFWNLLSHSVVMLGGQLKGREGVWLRSGEFIRIHTSRTLDIWADGEFVSQTPAYFDLQPNSLRVYVPGDYFTQE